MNNLNIIVATDANQGIGINNTLPWRLPEDLAHFKKITLGHPIIMGRKTFDSIGRPLPQRRNIVITRQTNWSAPGVEVAHSVLDAISLLEHQEGFIIGGSQIYAEAFSFVNKIYLTQIAHTFSCDAFFPTLNTNEWEMIEKEPHYSQENKFSYTFLTYKRV